MNRQLIRNSIYFVCLLVSAYHLLTKTNIVLIILDGLMAVFFAYMLYSSNRNKTKGDKE